MRSESLRRATAAGSRAGQLLPQPGGFEGLLTIPIGLEPHDQPVSDRELVSRHRVSYTDHPAVYSPAGDRIALSFVQWDTIHQNVFCGDIYTISAAGSDRQPVTKYCDGNPQMFTGIASSPSWQPLPGG